VTLVLVTQAPGACTGERASLSMTPVAMGIAKSMGGLPGLTTVIRVFAGIVGYVFGPAPIDRASVRDTARRCIAHGAAAPILVEARAAQESKRAGLAAGLVMALNALLLALPIPIPLLRLLTWTGSRHGHG